MKEPRWSLSAGAAFAGALLLAVLQGRELLALSLPILAHELGHVLAIRALGQRLVGFRAELGGFCLDYRGDAGPLEHGLIALAGPAAGLMYAALASRLGQVPGRELLCLSAGISLLLSLINLLPAAPLDGGRLCAVLAETLWGARRGGRICRLLSLGTGWTVLALGLLLALRGRGAAAALLGAGLLGRTIWREEGLVKRSEIR